VSGAGRSYSDRIDVNSCGQGVVCICGEDVKAQSKSGEARRRTTEILRLQMKAGSVDEGSAVLIRGQGPWWFLGWLTNGVGGR